MDKDLGLSHAVGIFFWAQLQRLQAIPSSTVLSKAKQYELKKNSAHLWPGMEKLSFNSHSEVVSLPEVHKVSLVRMRCRWEKPF